MVLWLAIQLLPLYGQSQLSEVGRPIINNFSHLDYNLARQNWATVQGSDDLIYVANSNGILQYDGVKWVKLTDDLKSVRSLAVDGTGRIYVGRIADFGYLQQDSIGTPRYVSLLEKIDPAKRNFQNIWEIHCLGEKIIFRAWEAIFIYNSRDDIRVIETTSRFESSFALNDQLFVQIRDLGLAVLDDSDALSVQLEKNNLPDDKVRAMFELNGRVMIGTRDKGFFWLDHGSLVSFPTEADKYLSRNQLYKAILLPNNRIGLATLKGGFVEIDHHGKWLSKIDRSLGLMHNTVSSAFLDKYNGLWLTLDNGTARVDYSQVNSIFDKTLGLPDGAAVLSIVRHQGKLFAGTSAGVFFLKGAHDPGENAMFYRLNAMASQSMDLISIGDILLVATEHGVYELNDHRLRQITTDASFSLYHSRADPRVIYVGQYNGVRVLKYAEQQWTEGALIPGLPFRTRYVVECNNGFVWISTEQKGIVRYDPDGKTPMRVYTTQDGLPAMNFNFANLVRGEVFIGSLNGLYRIDDNHELKYDSALNHLASINGLQALTLAENADGTIWLNADEGIVSLVLRNDDYDKVKTFWVPRPLIGNIIEIFPDDDGTIWIGGDFGIIRFNSNNGSHNETEFKTIVRNVKLNGDSLIYSGSPAGSVGKIPFHYNSISFEYAGLYYEESEKNQYRHYLEGLDDKWSNWEADTKKEYKRLSEGSYRFQVQAKNMYGHLGSIDTVEFRILPPWYRTLIAYAFYFLGALGGLAAILKWRFAYLEKERKRLEKIVLERTGRLSVQNQTLSKALNDLKKMQSQLVHSEKMASLGILTSGVAHEINNPVNFIKNGIDALHEELQHLLSLNRQASNEFMEAAMQVHDLVDSIRNGANRTADIIQSLRTFSRLGEDTPKQYNVEENINSTLLILKSKMGDRIEVVQQYCKTATLEVFPGRMNQVLMNVLDNAIQAILSAKDFGIISIKTEEAGDNLLIAISDNGPGIHPDHLKKIFDPFFTTKEIGKGTGLGLSISHSIIQEHGGKIWVKSEFGMGTDFFIELPVRKPELETKILPS